MNVPRHWLNGRTQASLDPEERALQYGDGVFETFRIRAANIEYLERHLARLRAGCDRLQLAPVDWQDLQQELMQRAEDVADGVLKVIIARAPGRRGYAFDRDQGVTRLVSAYPLPQWPENYYLDGVRVHLCELRLGEQPALAGIKHLNRLEQVLARAEWRDDCQEGLLFDHHNNLVEGTMSNVFVLKGDTLITPPLDRCGVAGVMRSVVLDLADELGLKAAVRAVPFDELQRVSGMLLCNSLIGIWPVKSIAGQCEFTLSATIGKLQDALKTGPLQDRVSWYAS